VVVKSKKLIIFLWCVSFSPDIFAMKQTVAEEIEEIKKAIEQCLPTTAGKKTCKLDPLIKKKLDALINQKDKNACEMVKAFVKEIDSSKLAPNELFALAQKFNLEVLCAINGSDSDQDNIGVIWFLVDLIKEVKKVNWLNNFIWLHIESFIYRNSHPVNEELIKVAKEMMRREETRSNGMSLLLELVKNEEAQAYDYAKEVIRNQITDKGGFSNQLFKVCVNKMSISDVDSSKDSKLWNVIFDEYNKWTKSTACVDTQGFIYYENIKRQNVDARASMNREEEESATYKIHLQVKNKYLDDFVRTLLDELRNPALYAIYTFKYTSDPTRQVHRSRDEQGGMCIPIIVLYIAKSNHLIDNEKRDKLIDPMLQEFIKFVDDFCHQCVPKITLQDLAWPVKPRFNKKINDVIYIAGGNGDYKPIPNEFDEKCFLESGKYKDTKCKKAGLEAIEYSDDLCFVKGHEYLTPQEREQELLKDSELCKSLKKLKESLSTLRGKLQGLGEKLELMQKTLLKD
jgi:hypothetical protein